VEIKFTLEAAEHLNWWKLSGNKKVQKKIQALIAAILEDPEGGIGKPEKLKYDLAGAWSRRITEEHQLVYEILEDEIKVVALKGHYE